MILNHKHLTIDLKKISIKKKQKFYNNFTFIPMSYNKKLIMIQSPLLYIPFDIQSYMNNSNQYLDLSFQNSINDKDIQYFLTNLELFYQKVLNLFSHKKYKINHFIKENKDSSKFIRFKINNYCLFFDQLKNIYKGQIKKKYGIFIIHLSGIWLINHKISFQWHVLQAKINSPIKLNNYMFHDSIPPPPPPPLPSSLSKYDKMIKIGIPKNAVEQKKKIDSIQPKDLQNVSLKKIDKKVIIHKKKSNDFTPTVEQLKNTLLLLKKVNVNR